MTLSKKRFLVFAWIRIGVPEALATYLIGMDYQAQMVVQAPLSIETFDKWVFKGLETMQNEFSTTTRNCARRC